MRKVFFLVAFILQTSLAFCQPTGRMTIINNLLWDVSVVVEGNDPTYFMSNGDIISNIFVVNGSSTVVMDPCIIQTFVGWNTIPGSAYSCSIPPSPYTIKWRDIRIALPSSATCSSVIGGVSDPDCGLLGLTSPYSFCTGGESATWSSTTGCPAGDNITVTINP